MQLVEDGRVVLTEPVRTYLPDFAPAPPPGEDDRSEPVLVWHVLTHTAGLSDAPDTFFDSGARSREELLARVSSARLRFPPGTAYAYCSDSFYVLAAIAERVAGQPFPELLRARIFEPLGMAATTFDPADPGPPPVPMTGSLGPEDVAPEVMQQYFISLAAPGGGLWSIPHDVARFGQAMLLGGTIDGVRILGRPFVRLMTRLHTGNVRDFVEQPQPWYGLGWGLPGLGRGSPASPESFGHGGATGSALIVDPPNDLVVVYLRNEWGAPTTATDEAIQAVYGALEDA
jgi:CubicO group peptidase (beta-lactamase class C family)